MTTNILADESSDRKYFISVPQIVMALCRTPYDFTLWCAVKMVAGEHSECILSTQDLSHLAMMSVGKVVDSRTYLLKVGLLEGSCYKEPNFPQQVWHLRVPDIWLKNIEWRQLFDSLKDRVELKRRLRALFEEADVLRNFNQELFEQLSSLHNVNIKSLHNMKPSQNEGGTPQNEGGTPQNEGGTPQNEAKKNHKKNQVEPKRKTIGRKRKNLTPVQEAAQQMFQALADLCKYDPDMITRDERGMLNQAESGMRERGYTPVDIEAFSKWWYEHDWRGQKGQPPTLADMRQTWGRFKEWQKNGGGNEHKHIQTHRTSITGLQERGDDNPIKKRFNPRTGETYWIDERSGKRVPGPVS